MAHMLQIQKVEGALDEGFYAGITDIAKRAGVAHSTAKDALEHLQKVGKVQTRYIKGRDTFALRTRAELLRWQEEERIMADVKALCAEAGLHPVSVERMLHSQPQVTLRAIEFRAFLRRALSDSDVLSRM